MSISSGLLFFQSIPATHIMRVNSASLYTVQYTLQSIFPSLFRGSDCSFFLFHSCMLPFRASSCLGLWGRWIMMCIFSFSPFQLLNLFLFFINSILVATHSFLLFFPLTCEVWYMVWFIVAFFFFYRGISKLIIVLFW